MRPMFPLVALALVLAGCGGATGEDAAPTTGEAADERSSALAREFADEGWKTDFSRREVSLTEFQSGGPPRDGIPPIDEPKFVTVAAADEDIAEREPVILFEHRGEVRVYPINIL